MGWLTVVMLAALFPNGVTALTADEITVLSFEEANPVATLTSQEKAAVNALPSELTAVVAVHTNAFSQMRPDSCGDYMAPADGEARYASGEAVVHSLHTADGTAYRVYGTANGKTGWFACDAGGYYGQC